MRHTTGALAVLAALAVLGAAVVGGCGGATAAQPASPSPSAPPSGVADITGVVRDVTPGGDPGTATLLVIADPDVASSVDRASVRVTARSGVWGTVGEGATEAGRGRPRRRPARRGVVHGTGRRVVPGAGRPPAR